MFAVILMVMVVIINLVMFVAMVMGY